MTRQPLKVARGLGLDTMRDRAQRKNENSYHFCPFGVLPGRDAGSEAQSPQASAFCLIFRLSGAITLTGCIVIALCGNYVLAQITPDGTLGTERSVVTSDINIKGAIADRIDGGAIRGANLFHSFTQFNIGDGQRVYFANPVGIENILTRVTGINASNVLGTLGVTGGNANLFLINPNGIVFGPNANLNLNGSFVATTANAIQFGDRGFFSASAPESPLLLSVNPSAFFFNQIATQPITNQARLQVPTFRSLLLVGGDITINGGRLNAPDGRVELGGLASAGTIALNVDGNNLSLSFPDSAARSNLSLTNGAKVDVSGEGGGFIQVQGSAVTVAEGSEILAETEGSQNGKGIFIQASQLVIRDGSQISASALEGSQGNGGGITVNALESVELIGTSSGNQGSGSGGGQGSGSGGSQGGGSGDNERPSRLASDAQGAGKAGDLIVNTRRLVVRDGARISASTIDKPGGGNLVVNASESVEVIGTSSQRQRSSTLSVQTRGVGQAGSLTINTGRLIVRDGAEVSASTFGRGDGGDVIVNASESVKVLATSRNGALSSRLVAETGRPLDTRDVGTVVGTGQGGSVYITTGQLVVRDGGQVSVSGLSTQPTRGDAGDLNVTANSIELDNKGAIAATTTSGNGGNITLQVQDLLWLRQNSQISTTAGTLQAGGNGGNITINSGFIVAPPKEESDITANAFKGRGGNTNITATGIYGIEFRPRPTSLSDITASSDFGVDGIVDISTLEINPSYGLVELPTTLVDRTNQIAQVCSAANRESRFTVIGRGGLPQSPTEVLSPDMVQDDLGTPVVSNSLTHESVKPSPTSPPKQLVEAQGWVVDDKGIVTLIAAAPAVTPHSPALVPAACQSGRTKGV
jgi:filamentous hemagglutinin family protein